MLASRVHLLLHVQSIHHGILLRGLTSHASSSWYGGGPRRRYHKQHQEVEREEARAVKVTVWWDFQRCRLPQGVHPRLFAPRITAALRRAGIRGPVEITAFGDVSQIARAEQEVLADTGVSFSHVPSSGKDGFDRSFMSDIIYWIAQNPPPVHFFLISEDINFANILHRLRMSNYNILLACPDVGSRSLRSAATFMWPWKSLFKGVDLRPKYLNHPPDGLYCSWYGHYREAGDDLLLKPKNPMRSAQNTTVPKVPRFMVDRIKQVLQFNPEGLSVPNLRAELKRINVPIKRGIVGFKSFSAALHAIPDVVKFIDPLPGRSDPSVVGVFKTSVESCKQSFNIMDSFQSSDEENRLNENKSEVISSWDVESSSTELLSNTEKITLDADVSSSPSDQLSGDQRKAAVFDLTGQLEIPSNSVEADATLAADVPLPSNAMFRDQKDAEANDLVTKTESPVSRMEADMVGAAGTPFSLGAQVNNTKKKGLFGRILCLWNDIKRKPEL